jgi:hypothetical protein
MKPLSPSQSSLNCTGHMHVCQLTRSAVSRPDAQAALFLFRSFSFISLRFLLSLHITAAAALVTHHYKIQGKSILLLLLLPTVRIPLSPLSTVDGSGPSPSPSRCVLLVVETHSHFLRSLSHSFSLYYTTLQHNAIMSATIDNNTATATATAPSAVTENKVSLACARTGSVECISADMVAEDTTTAATVIALALATAQ